MVVGLVLVVFEWMVVIVGKLLMVWVRLVMVAEWERMLMVVWYKRLMMLILEEVGVVRLVGAGGREGRCIVGG